MKDYNPNEIEKKWQDRWQESGLYKTPNNIEGKKNEYILVEFAYPSGNLHVGHWYAFSVTDIYARFRRMKGFNVMFPFGFDSFGLPAENAAIKRGVNPRDWTYDNIAHMRKQLVSMGAMFDWSREVVTSDPEYYQWTQWLFLQLFKNGLVYQAEREEPWCPSCKTVLAREQVVDGRCDRCGTEVIYKKMLQWNVKITDYADRLLGDLETLDWPDPIKQSQKNWIGRSEGALIKFDHYEVFTTRPDTIRGATFLAISGKEDRFTGEYVTNLATSEKIPVWEAEYVLSDYGTGAVMGVPADDERDRAFAEKHSLSIVEEYEKAGFEEFGQRVTKYKLRDWVVSRQRYWGCPIPIIHCEKCGPQPVSERDLPVALPEIEDFLPNDEGRSPLSKVESFVHTKCPKCGGEGRRETDTLDTFVDSSWYFVAYCMDKEVLNKPVSVESWKSQFANFSSWLPVDFYSGGAEHTTMHLLYSRFFHKALFDLGLVAEAEPYTRRLNRGLILGPDGNKMSKSKGNVVDPDDYVTRLGADTVRAYLAFIGPYNEIGSYPWSPDSIVGVRRFLEKVWSLQSKLATSNSQSSTETLMHQTIKKVEESLSSLKMNTAVSALMICVNSLEKQENVSQEDYKTLLKLLAPLAPHIAEELWHSLGEEGSIHLEPWPEFDESKLASEIKTITVQVDGRVRATLEVGLDESENLVKERAMNLDSVAKWLVGKEIQKTIFVRGRVVNFLTS